LAESKTHQYKLESAGLTGAVGSSDAMHVGMEQCSYRLMNLHSGPKLKMPSWTYNITVNHRRILSTTHGHPACWNDKTIVLFDAFVRGIYEGKILDDNQFTLFELDKKGGVVEVQYQGTTWLLVDNGYLNWPTTVPPFNHTIH
jgi:hypothetical protein